MMFNFPTILGCSALLLLLGAIVRPAKLFYHGASIRAPPGRLGQGHEPRVRPFRRGDELTAIS
jgi:hypothetical protein